MLKLRTPVWETVWYPDPVKYPKATHGSESDGMWINKAEPTVYSTVEEGSDLVNISTTGDCKYDPTGVCSNGPVVAVAGHGPGSYEESIVEVLVHYPEISNETY